MIARKYNFSVQNLLSFLPGTMKVVPAKAFDSCVRHCTACSYAWVKYALSLLFATTTSVYILVAMDVDLLPIFLILSVLMHQFS